MNSCLQGLSGVLRKTPQIAPTAFVSEAAYVVGDVEIGENSSVWPGAVIRGDFDSIKIGKNTHIQDNCVVHGGAPLVIGDNVNVGHSAVIHCARIGNNVLIGIHATILDDVEIGNLCVIGATAMVSQGMKIPARSFVVGVPAYIKGEVPDARVARLGAGTGGYSRMTQEFKRQGL